VNTELLIQLNGIPGVGPSTIERLRAIGDIHHCSVADLQQQGVSFSQAQAVVTGLADRSFLERELALIAQHRIGILTISDPEYPALLRAIYAPPPVLYYQGAKPTFDKTLAFVGSRAGQQYARTVIGTLVPPLITAGCTIVSGGARGVDFYAHQTALDQAGSTVAVLGSGLLEPYPPTSKPLFTRIIESGSSLVSSFPLKTKPVAGNFPARNRIIAGLSQGCVVVAAADKSGALITARFALEQGREVFAVPGAIDDPLSVGCHRLIQQGGQTGPVCGRYCPGDSLAFRALYPTYRGQT